MGFIRPLEDDMYAVGLELDVHDAGAGTALPGQPAHPPEASYSWRGPNPFAPPPSAPDLFVAPGGPDPFAPLPTSPAPAAAPQANADLVRADQGQMDEDLAFAEFVDAEATWHADAEGADDDLLDGDGDSSGYMVDEWGAMVPLPTAITRVS